MTRRGALARLIAASPVVGVLLGLVLTTAAWYVASLHELVPAPHNSVRATYRKFATGELTPHFVWTMRASFQGFAIGAGFGVVVGLALGASYRLRQVFAEGIYGLASVPKLILYPLVIAVFGLGVASEIAFVALSCFFLVLINTMIGAQEVSLVLLKVGRAYNLSRWQTLAKVFLPSIAPSLVTGLRLGLSMALVHAVLAEMTIGNDGLGTRIWFTYRDLDVASLYGIVFLVVIVGVTGNVLLWYLEKRLRGGDMKRVWAAT